MEKKAIFPGSFDPFTKGHEAVVRKALPLFDKIVIGIGVNSNKKYFFTLDQRLNFIKQVFRHDLDKIDVMSYEGLTVNFCQEQQIGFIVRGLRNGLDFQFEYEIANMNRNLNPSIESVFIASMPEHSAINSTIVREILRNGGDVSTFIPVGAKLPT
jgi:pantetheine-phosphate adenylyltransferase